MISNYGRIVGALLHPPPLPSLMDCSLPVESTPQIDFDNTRDEDEDETQGGFNGDQHSSYSDNEILK